MLNRFTLRSTTAITLLPHRPVQHQIPRYLCMQGNDGAHAGNLAEAGVYNRAISADELVL
jgi:hypothetical protein